MVRREGVLACEVELFRGVVGMEEDERTSDNSWSLSSLVLLLESREILAMIFCLVDAAIGKDDNIEDSDLEAGV